MEAFAQKYKMNYVSKSNDENNVSIVINISGNHDLGFQKMELLTKSLRKCLDDQLQDYQNEEAHSKQKETEKQLEKQKQDMEKQKLKQQKDQEHQMKKKHKEQLKIQKEKQKLLKKFE